MLTRVCSVHACACGLYTALCTLAGTRYTGRDYIVDGTPRHEHMHACTHAHCDMYTLSLALARMWAVVQSPLSVHNILIYSSSSHAFYDPQSQSPRVQRGQFPKAPLSMSQPARERMAHRLLDIKCGSGASRRSHAWTPVERTRDCRSAGRIKEPAQRTHTHTQKTYSSLLTSCPVQMTM